MAANPCIINPSYKKHHFYRTTMVLSSQFTVLSSLFTVSVSGFWFKVLSSRAMVSLR
jgi:hypothetical protein